MTDPGRRALRLMIEEEVRYMASTDGREAEQRFLDRLWDTYDKMNMHETLIAEKLLGSSIAW